MFDPITVMKAGKMDHALLKLFMELRNSSKTPSTCKAIEDQCSAILTFIKDANDMSKAKLYDILTEAN